MHSEDLRGGTTPRQRGKGFDSVVILIAGASWDNETLGVLAMLRCSVMLPDSAGSFRKESRYGCWQEQLGLID
jgi:hypothetical protein